MSSKGEKTAALLFSVYLTVVFVMNLIIPDRPFSDKENRFLQPFPSFSAASVTDGTFSSRFEEYCSDHFIGRDVWIALKARLELLQGKNENNGVFLCQGERLIEPLTVPEPEEVQRRIESVNSFAGRVSVPVVLGLIPTQAEIYSELLPSGVKNASQSALISAVYKSTETESCADIIGALESYKNDYIFYRTDHHWTTLGANRAYAVLTDLLGIPERSDFDRRVVSTDFCGTSYSSSGFFWIRPDTMEIYINSSKDVVAERYESGNVRITGLYDDSMLETKDKYRYFLGGNCARIVLRTGKEDLPSLLIIRDSYADSLVPFFLQDYSEIHLLDLRYYRDPPAEYVSQYGIDSVLILYSTENFLNDSGIMLLGR